MVDSLFAYHQPMPVLNKCLFLYCLKPPLVLEALQLDTLSHGEGPVISGVVL